jgi:hypothetical protein
MEIASHIQSQNSTTHTMVSQFVLSSIVRSQEKKKNDAKSWRVVPQTGNPTGQKLKADPIQQWIQARSDIILKIIITLYLFPHSKIIPFSTDEKALRLYSVY